MDNNHDKNNIQVKQTSEISIEPNNSSNNQKNDIKEESKEPQEINIEEINIPDSSKRIDPYVNKMRETETPINRKLSNCTEDMRNYNGKKIIYTGKPFPKCLAAISFIVNLFLPGIGTMIGTCGMNETVMKNEYMLKGCFQLISTIVIIGWFYALYTSIYYCSASCSKRPFESYRRKRNLRWELRNNPIKVGIDKIDASN